MPVGGLSQGPYLMSQREDIGVIMPVKTFADRVKADQLPVLGHPDRALVVECEISAALGILSHHKMLLPLSVSVDFEQMVLAGFEIKYPVIAQTIPQIPAGNFQIAQLLIDPYTLIC